MSNLATIVNNILADSGIDDINVVVTNGSYSNPAWITALSWSKITSTPTTLSGYGITDAVPAIRTITINGDTQDLSANRTWTIAAGVTSVNAGTGISVNQTTGAVTVTNTGTLTIAGTTNQVLVNGGTAAANGNITLSLPQSIGTSNTPTFGGLVVSGTETRQINLVLPASYNGTGYGNLIERINFPWYSEYWDIGVRRGGASDIQSMEFWLNGTTKIFEITKTSGLAYLGGNTILTSANYTSYAVPTSGYEFSTTFSLGTMFASTGIQGTNLDYMIGVYTNGYIYRFTSGAVASWIGLGSYLPLSGGTLTGTLFFSNNIGTAIQGTMGNNDFWRIYATGGDNAGYLEIATADDGAEPIYISQYSGVFSTLIRRITLLDGSGNSTFPGTINSTISDYAFVSQSDGTSGVWRGRILSKNATANVSSFLGTYASIAGVFAHNNALSAWADLYVNTVDGSGGGTVRMPANVYINGYQAVYNTGTWGISITGNADTVDGFHATNAASGLAYYASNGYLYIPSWMNVDNGGIFSSTNNAHFRPNSGTFGPWLVTGSRNSYRGLEFESGSNGNVALMIHDNSNTTGFHNNSYGWQFYWESGSLYVLKNTYGGGTQATVLDSSNYNSWAAAVNGNVSNTFNVFQLSYAATAFNPSAGPRTIMNSMSVKMWQNYFNGTGLGSDYGTVMQYYSLGGHVDTQVYFDASGGSWYRTASYAAGWQSWQKYVTENGGTWGISITGNADTVDGYHAYPATVADGIVVRNSSGYILGNYINMSDDGDPGSGTSITSFITKQGDNYYRSVSPTNAMVSIRGVASGTWGINVTGTAGSETLATVVSRGNSTGGGRPIVLDNGGGAIITQANAGGWAMGTYYKGSGGTTLAGFGAYGGFDSLTYAWIGSAYDSAWMTINSGTTTFSTAVTINGVWQTNISTTGGWSKLSFTASNNWGDGTTYGTLGASGGNEPGVMINNMHATWANSSNGAGVRMGRSGGVSTGAWYQVATMASDEFMIAKYGQWANGGLKIASNGLLYYGETGHQFVYNTGTWGISISGNAATATSATSSTYSNYLVSYSASVNNGFASWNSYDDTTNNPGNSWWYGMRVSHGDAISYYSFSIGANFFANEVYYRRIQGGTSGGWIRFLDANNYGSYALPLTGGTVTGATIYTGTLFARKAQTAGNYTTAALWTESYDNTTTGIAFHISGVIGKFLEMRTNGVLYWYGDVVLHSGNYNSYSPTLTGGGASGTWGISITGNAATATNASQLGGISSSGFYREYGTIAPAGGLNGTSVGWTALDGYGSPVPNYPGGNQWWVGVWQGGNASRGIQIAGGYSDNELYFRKGADTWGGWIRTLTNFNYTDYTVTKTGGGASGTWGISVTGTAASETLSTVTGRGNTTGSNIITSANVYGNAFYYYSDNAYYINPGSSAYLRGPVQVTGGHNNSLFQVLLRADENFAATGQVTLRAWCSEPGVTWDWAGFGYNVQNDGAAPYGFGRINTNFGQAYMRFSTGGQLRFYNANTSGTRVETAIFAETGAVTFNYAVNLQQTLYVNSTATISYSGLSGDFGAGYTTGMGVGYSVSVSKGINMGWNTTYDMGFIGTVHNGTAWKSLTLCPIGGAVYIGITGNNYIYAGAFFEGSDKRLKQIVKDDYRAIGIESIKTRLYTKEGKLEIGYYAQDLEDILPSAVSKSDSGFLGLSYTQVHTAKIAYLEDSIEEIKAKILYLENQLKTKQ